MEDSGAQNSFKSGQIVCLESGKKSLYGEVIQVVIDRQLCWVRPLTIAVESNDLDSSFDVFESREIIDLRSASDLLLPLTLFRASYDTEAISLLSKLATKEESFDRQQMSLYLNKFIKQVWQENQDKFN